MHAFGSNQSTGTRVELDMFNKTVHAALFIVYH